MMKARSLRTRNGKKIISKGMQLQYANEIDRALDYGWPNPCGIPSEIGQAPEYGWPNLKGNPHTQALSIKEKHSQQRET